MGQTGTRLLKKEVVHLEDRCTLNNKTQSNEMLLKVVQTDNKLFKKEIVHLKDTKTLLNKARSTEIFLEKVQTNSNLLKERFSTLEKETADFEHKSQSMTVGAKTLFEKIHTVKCINRTLSKGHDRLTDKMSLQ